MLNKEIPFIRITLPFCAGIVSGLFFNNPERLLLLSLPAVVIIGFLISLLFNKYQINILYGVTLTIALFLCGLFMYRNEKNKLSDLEPEYSKFFCTMSEFPDEKNKTFRFTVKLHHKITSGEQIPVRGSLLLYCRKAPSVSSLNPGDFLLIECKPEEIENRGNPGEFDFKFYMENRGIKYFSFINPENIICSSLPLHRKLVHKALIIRKKIISMYSKRGITGERLALVAALILGEKKMLDPEQKQNFMKAGVMHIMAVSGLHAMILSLFVLNSLFFLKKRFNILRIFMAVVFLWLFAFITGLNPSVLRASLMFTFLQTGKMIRRDVNNINSVLASAFVILMIRPASLFDAGFLLSYSAVLFIICFYQDLYLKLTVRYWFPDKLWQSAVVTITAQAGTLPLTVTLFNRFPAYFILTNLIIVPLTFIIIITGCLILITFPFNFISEPLASILNCLAGLTEYLTAKVSSFPFSSLENIGMPCINCFLLSLTIFLLSWSILKKESIPAFYPMVALLLFAITGTAGAIKTRLSDSLIVYNTHGSSTIGIRNGVILNLYSASKSVPDEVRRHASAAGLKILYNKRPEKFMYIKAGNSNILITSDLNENIRQMTRPDFLILTSVYSFSEKKFTFKNPVKALIIIPEVLKRDLIPVRLSSQVIDTIHYVRISGAFQMKL